MADYVLPGDAPYPRSALGWDGVDYRVLSINDDARLQAPLVPRVFNHYGQYRQQVVELNPGVIDYILYGTACPVGLLFKITNIYAFDSTTNITSIHIGTRLGVQLYDIHAYAPTAAGDPLMWNGEIWVDPTYQIFAQYNGSLVGDDLFLNIHGYIMLGVW